MWPENQKGKRLTTSPPPSSPNPYLAPGIPSQGRIVVRIPLSLFQHCLTSFLRFPFRGRGETLRECNILWYYKRQRSGQSKGGRWGGVGWAGRAGMKKTNQDKESPKHVEKQVFFRQLFLVIYRGISIFLFMWQTVNLEARVRGGL